MKRPPHGDYAGKRLAGVLDQYLTSAIGIDDSQFQLSLLGGPRFTHTCANPVIKGVCVVCKFEVISERARIIALTALYCRPTVSGKVFAHFLRRSLRT